MYDESDTNHFVVQTKEREKKEKHLKETRTHENDRDTDCEAIKSKYSIPCVAWSVWNG